MMTPSPKIIQLSNSEALVLYDFLWRFGETGKLEIVDQAEEKALWIVLGNLEKQLAEIFDPNFVELLKKARDEIRDDEFEED